MDRDEALAYCLAKPGAWLDSPWDESFVVKVGPKIFAFLLETCLKNWAESERTNGAFASTGNGVSASTSMTSPAMRPMSKSVITTGKVE